MGDFIAWNTRFEGDVPGDSQACGLRFEFTLHGAITNEDNAAVPWQAGQRFYQQRQPLVLYQASEVAERERVTSGSHRAWRRAAGDLGVEAGLREDTNRAAATLALQYIRGLPVARGCDGWMTVSLELEPAEGARRGTRG